MAPQDDERGNFIVIDAAFLYKMIQELDNKVDKLKTQIITLWVALPIASIILGAAVTNVINDLFGAR